MRFDLTAVANEAYTFREPQVGDVYPAQGGRPTVAWVVVATPASGGVAHMLGIDKHGDVCSTTSYAFRALEDRPRIGFVELQDLVFSIQATSQFKSRRSR